MTEKRRLSAAEERDLYDKFVELLATVEALRREVAALTARVTVAPPKP